MADEITPALILDHVLYSERDLILTLLTRHHGVVSAIARSARGSRRRFGGALDLFVVFNANLRLKPPGRLSTLSGAEPARQFPGILDDLERLETGQAMLFITRDILRDSPAGKTTFDTVVDCLSQLDEAPTGKSHGALIELCMKLLADISHAPDSFQCPDCHTGFLEKQGAVLFADGVVLCKDCSSDRSDVSVQLSFGENSMKDTTGTEVPTRRESLEFLAALLSNVLGRNYRIPLGD